MLNSIFSILITGEKVIQSEFNHFIIGDIWKIALMVIDDYWKCYNFTISV